MNKYEETTLEAIIASAVDEIVGVVHDDARDVAKVQRALGLTEAQARLAVQTTVEVFKVNTSSSIKVKK